jgi:hypothetical protein
VGIDCKKSDVHKQDMNFYLHLRKSAFPKEKVRWRRTSKFKKIYLLDSLIFNKFLFMKTSNKNYEKKNFI